MVGATKEDPNSNGKLMASIAAKLTDAEVKALSEYTAGLKGQLSTCEMSAEQGPDDVKVIGLFLSGQGCRAVSMPQPDC